MVKNYFRLTLVYMISGKHHNPHPIFRQETPECERVLYRRPYPGVLGVIC